MATWLFALVAVSGLVPESQRAADAPAPFNSTTICQRIVLLRDRLIGRLVGSCIREGMTGKDVDSITRNWIFDRGQFGPGNGFWVGYSRYGLDITFGRDDADPTQEWRVARVSYIPLLGDYKLP